MKFQCLKANCKTVHLGGFSPKLEPALFVNSGDRIEVETYTGFYVCDRAPEEFLTPELLNIYHNLPPERKVGTGPHLLTGPIYIREAQPGDVLEVRLLKITPRLPMGFNAIRPGWGTLPQQFSEAKLRFIPLDLERKIAEFPPKSGMQIPLQPFFGILGVADGEVNRSSVPPGVYGGNMDNRLIQAGTRVFLPVLVPGALFSIGDGHSVQGDGEVDVTAIETSMNGTIDLVLHRGFKLPTPMAETPTHLIIMGFGETLDLALENAVQQAIDVLKILTGIDGEDAYVLCSLAVDFRITQAVNRPQKGVHGMIPKSILPDDCNYLKSEWDRIMSGEGG
ncbi:MAG TPA: acetamidase/formamidase family protein [Oscillatoriales cyanobacterium M59_W2019_021]|nr:MAG: acetamidase [Cyanobacteria bacterium J055]HIK31985.1 acetamidase/formamidase family protein [Oscillatoriales cyanobacterium M4454_W2019_049]HIK49498.1 acetamidase/formamidase family protein [Oscillatoriales cyanobacterium M59_W2019_021]